MAVKINGTDAIIEDLEKMMPSDTDLTDLLEEAADILIPAIRANINSKTKQLYNSIGSRVKTGREGKSIIVGPLRKNWGPGEYYAPYVEYGHRGPKPTSKATPPHPYIRPAVEKTKKEIHEIFEKGMLKKIDQTNKNKTR